MRDWKNLFSLEGKKAMVIGGATGIGQAIAEGLASFGADVAIASRNEESLKNGAKEIEENCGKKIRWYQVDVADEQSVIDLVKKVRADVGTTDILVNSMGYNVKFHTLDNRTDEWDMHYRVNVRGLMICCREFGRGMVEQKWGRIINIGSSAAFRHSPSGISGAYSSTKGAVMNYSKSLAIEWAKYNITVNEICPILTGTKMMLETLQKDMAHYEQVKNSNPMGRIGEPEDCIGMAVFFASEAGSFVTGQYLAPDGGRLCT